jgi:Protein of unknwon function (DUF3310)
MSESTNDYQVGGEHYKKMAIEPWEVMQAVLTHEEWVGFLKGNIIKYSMRQGRKVDAHDDGEKAKHYLAKLAEVEEEADIRNIFLNHWDVRIEEMVMGND